MLMRVDMAGLASGELDKAGHLPGNLLLDSRHIVHCDDIIQGYPIPVIIDPLAKVHMQAEAEVRVLASIVCGIESSWPAHHQTGTCHDPVLICLDNAVIDRVAVAEVISIDDQKALSLRCRALHC